jgi:hypothetical protein
MVIDFLGDAVSQLGIKRICRANERIRIQSEGLIWRYHFAVRLDVLLLAKIRWFVRGLMRLNKLIVGA